MMKQYSYPALSNRDLGIFRIGGPGLANCLFFACEAYVHSVKNNSLYIEPTWTKFSIGPWIRREKDKRFYNQLFKSYGLNGVKKLLLINRFNPNRTNIHKFDSIGNYFTNLNHNYDLVSEYLSKIINPKTISKVPEDLLEGSIAVHVRLGDYLPHLRIDINWYRDLISAIQSIFPEQKFLIFSDGSEEELKPVLSLPMTSKVFFGNAFADMYAISKCKLVIASDSTFSAWGAFIGRKPIIFSKRHFPSVYNGDVPEFVLGDKAILSEDIISIIKKD